MRIVFAMICVITLAGFSGLAAANATGAETDADNKDNSTHRIVNPEHTPTNTEDSGSVAGKRKSGAGQETQNGAGSESATPDSATESGSGSQR